MQTLFTCLLPIGLLASPLSAETTFELSGKVEVEATVFQEEGQFTGQDYQENGSFAVEPEFYWGWNDDYDSITFKPFVRVDAQDEERSHVDIRELLWTHVTDDWEFRVGISKVFWGVTEFNHLIDIINQSDTVDSFDGEEKLGQPMIVASKVTDMGIFDAYVLPGFRERTFAGEDGRFRSGFVVNTDNATYEDEDEEQHIDFALRWSHSVDVFDFGLYGFQGTDRAPILRSATKNGTTVLQPHYQQITQFGLDAQATIDSWLLKLEAIATSSDDQEDYTASQAGFEYTFYGIADSLVDFGLLLEYGWDERGEEASSIAQNDVYLGGRFTLNDTSDTAILFGMSYDNDHHSKTALLEASQRLNDYWSAALDASIIIAEDSQDSFLTSLDKDDRISLTLERFF
ncbi:hypothetical protein CBF23_006490 [Marinomonas agarivorans]|nr:hypothetical protein CBF23_006490 [Marinomonas agarivorans]